MSDKGASIPNAPLSHQETASFPEAVSFVDIAYVSNWPVSPFNPQAARVGYSSPCGHVADPPRPPDLTHVRHRASRINTLLTGNSR
jgi:hypothetical protein